jgi:glycosyltransferase involved in cell wall biosynthesis
MGLGTAGHVAEEARRRGIEPVLRFGLPKHRGLTLNWRDVRAYLFEHPHEIVHCHMMNDHSIAVAAARRMSAIVRSSYCGTGFVGQRRRTGRCLRESAFLIEPSRIALDHDLRQFGYPADRTAVVPTAIDTERFNPERVSGDAREALGIPGDAFVLGIVARMQRHRLFEVLLEAFRRAAAGNSRLHLIIVGRGTHQQAVAKDPVREMGLEDRVHFAGYVSGDDYVRTIKAFDMKVFMMPGSDGTCRAVREAMAMGKGAIVNRIGMLPELIEDGKTGYVFDGSVEGLQSAIEKAAGDRAGVQRMGEEAKEIAHREFSLDVQAERIAAIYERVLAE